MAFIEFIKYLNDTKLNIGLQKLFGVLVSLLLAAIFWLYLYWQGSDIDYESEINVILELQKINNIQSKDGKTIRHMLILKTKDSKQITYKSFGKIYPIPKPGDHLPFARFTAIDGSYKYSLLSKDWKYSYSLK